MIYNIFFLFLLVCSTNIHTGNGSSCPQENSFDELLNYENDDCEKENNIILDIYDPITGSYRATPVEQNSQLCEIQQEPLSCPLADTGKITIQQPQPLLDALQTNNCDELTRLLKSHGPNEYIHLACGASVTPLHIAIWQEKGLELTRILLESGADLTKPMLPFTWKNPNTLSHHYYHNVAQRTLTPYQLLMLFPPSLNKNFEFIRQTWSYTRNHFLQRMQLLESYAHKKNIQLTPFAYLLNEEIEKDKGDLIGDLLRKEAALSWYFHILYQYPTLNNSPYHIVFFIKAVFQKQFSPAMHEKLDAGLRGLLQKGFPINETDSSHTTLLDICFEKKIEMLPYDNSKSQQQTYYPENSLLLYGGILKKYAKTSYFVDGNNQTISDQYYFFPENLRNFLSSLDTWNSSKELPLLPADQKQEFYEMCLLRVGIFAEENGLNYPQFQIIITHILHMIQQPIQPLFRKKIACAFGSKNPPHRCFLYNLCTIDNQATNLYKAHKNNSLSDTTLYTHA